MTIRNTKTLLTATSVASSVGSWAQLDDRYDENSERSFYGDLTSGDSVYIDLSYEESDTSADADFTTAEVYSSVSFRGVINGPWVRIRARKTGSTGPANVKARV